MNKIFINKKGTATLVMVMLPIGSYYEPNDIKGISHFLEHFCFKGTKTRTREDIRNAIENVGGDLNAFTCEEMTAYHATVANKHKDMAIKVITDLALNPIFPVKEIDKEREVIIQELKMYQDNPSSAVCDLYNKVYYPENHGLHYSTVGTEKSLHNIGRKELMNFHQEHYNNPTLIVIGDVQDFEEIDYANKMNITNNILYKQKQSKYFETRKIEQAHIIIGNDIYLPQYSNLDKMFMLELLRLVFNGMSGRLFGKIREDNNLVYNIKFDSEIWSGGMITWYVKLGLEKNKISKAHKLIEQEMLKIVSKKELETTIMKTIGTNALEMEDINVIAELIVYTLRKGTDYRPLYHDFEKNIRRVSGNLNDFMKTLNFRQNLMVGIVPKG